MMGTKGEQAMTDYIHAREQLSQGDVVVVECDHQCNIRLTDDQNFEHLKHGDQHKYYGGFYRILPARIVVPHSGYWNITLDLGNNRANVKYSIKYIKGSMRMNARAS
jgi:hypothetical protein